MRLLYNIFIFLYTVAVNIAALFNAKAKLWVAGRKNIFEKINSSVKPGEELIWFHCASLGEFEQGRPVMERIKKQEPGVKILLTFFSPSGYEIRKDYEFADYVFYLPMDSAANAKKFVQSLNIKAAFFVKYEFWFNYLHELKNKKVPTYMISGIFRDDHYFFKWYGGWAKKQLTAFTEFFLQDEHSKTILSKNGFTNSIVVGDTRFDRVYEIAQNKKEFPLVKLFVGLPAGASAKAGNSIVIICGSTWPKDESLVVSSEYLEKRIKSQEVRLIIAPHEIHESHIESIEKLFGKHKTIRYSKATEQNVLNSNILIIDNIGMLASLYSYGNIAYIGGGFDDGIHSILEAAVYGLPVLFGPHYKKFHEAVELIQLQGAVSVNNKEELQKQFELLLIDKTELEKRSVICKNYVLNKKGVSEKIIAAIKL